MLFVNGCNGCWLRGCQKKCCETVCETVETTLRGAKVKENKIIKVFGRSPQALYYLLQAHARENIHLL